MMDKNEVTCNLVYRKLLKRKGWIEPMAASYMLCRYYSNPVMKLICEHFIGPVNLALMVIDAPNDDALKPLDDVPMYFITNYVQRRLLEDKFTQF